MILRTGESIPLHLGFDRAKMLGLSERWMRRSNEQITAVIASNSSLRGPEVVEKAGQVKLNELNAEKIPKFR